MNASQIEKEIRRLHEQITNDIIAIYDGKISDQEAQNATDRLIAFFRILLETNNDER